MSFRRKFLVVVIFLFLFEFCVFSESRDAKVAMSVPKDSHVYWRVGFSSFSGKNLDRDNLYLTFSIPLLLRETLEEIRRHSFNSAVMIDYKRMVISDAISNDINKINLLIGQRDNLAFSDVGRSMKIAKLREIETSLRRLREHLNFLRGLNPEKIEINSEKEIKYVSSKGFGKLLEAPRYSPMELAEKYNLDLLVWGRVEQIGEVFFLKIGAYERALGRNVFSYVDAGARESIYRGINNAVNKLANVIMGRDWGTLEISVKPKDSAVYIDGNFIGSGDQRVRFIPTGKVSVSVSKLGYYSKRVEVEIDKNSETSVSIVLKKRKVKRILINSLPTNASVYLNSLWVGRTPVSIELPESVSRVTVKKEGFNDYEFSLYPEMERQSITVKLKSEILSKEKLEEKKRDAFYNAFGYWLITLPIPVFSFGLAVDFKVGQILAIVNSDERDASSMALYSDIMYYAYWGGIFVSTSLFINAVVRLADYIKSVD